MKKAVKKEKKIKLESIPKINRRLFKKWSEVVRKNQTCEYCGKKVGDLSLEGKPLLKVDAHHVQSRKVKDNPLKFDIENGICLCPLHHKFSCNESFHRSPVITINWLMINRPKSFKYILENFNVTVDLQNREVLKAIEKYLDEGKSLDIPKLKEIEAQFPKEPKKTRIPKKLVGNLFEEEESSSSSGE